VAIIDFILERVDEEETLAHRALDDRGVADRWESGSYAEHYDRWNPWRVQSACIVKRLLVRAHANNGPTIHRRPGHPQQLLAATCRTCRDADGQPSIWPCYSLRVLASEWSHHPDYRSEWRPQSLKSGAARSSSDLHER
jgi:hypothetical protein